MKAIEKPTDEKLRKLIRQTPPFMNFIIISIFVSIIGYGISNNIKWLLLLVMMVIVMCLARIVDNQDKIRLEIRELKKKKG